jgi:hypothetical protein
MAPLPILACKSKAGAVCAVANCVPNCKVIKKKGGAGKFYRTFTGGQRADFVKISASHSFVSMTTYRMQPFQPDPSRWTVPLKDANTVHMTKTCIHKCSIV